jgi:hypothetical protein
MTFDNLQEVPQELWITLNPNRKRIRALSGDTYVIQILDEGSGIHRICVNRHDWEEGISWDDLQAIKNACGYQDFDAVEVYPKHDDVLNVGNFRHLWVMPILLPFVWRVASDPNAFCLRYVNDVKAANV